MPGPGAHLRSSAATANPFADQPPRMIEYTAIEIATLQSRLDKQLGPEYISTRPGAGGGKVHYLAAEKVINLANEVFGFNGWSSEVKQSDIDFVDENPETKKISIGLAVIVRVTLKDGTFHEDMGYGQIENCKGKAAAFEKARKEAVTDALKRALRSFGKVLGNCLYDKDYLAKVSKVRMQPAKWDEKRLHRHPDFAPSPIKPEPQGKPISLETPTTGVAPNQGLRKPHSESADFEDDFGGGNLFDGVEIGPDEVLVPADAIDSDQKISMKPRSPRIRPAAQSLNGLLPATVLNDAQSKEAANMQYHPGGPPHNDPAVLELGFVTSRAAAGKDEPLSMSAVASLPRFNPNSESPSIRKTNGFNHNASAPVKRASLPGGAQQPTGQEQGNTVIQAPNQSGPPQGPSSGSRNFVNPAMDPSRRVGMPSGNASPMSHRGAFKHPGPAGGGAAKRPLPADTSAGRSPLSDVSNTSMPNARAEDTAGKAAIGHAPAVNSGDGGTKRARTAAQL